MVPKRRFLSVCLLSLLPLSGLCAAAGNEKGAFSSAYKAFEDGFYERAETELAAFGQTYTNSARLAEAVVLQAQARVQLKRFDEAIALLSANLAKAGPLAYEYAFWLGESYLRMGNHARAAQEFANLLQQYAGSPRSLDAVIGEATARSRLAEWQRVTELLLQTNGVFQSLARTNPTAERVVMGYLLLGEAQLARQDLGGLEATVQLLAKLQLAPRLAWQRQHLTCRLLQAQGRLPEALSGVTNLLALATNAAQRPFLAESFALQAELFERLGRGEEAMDTYQYNLGEGVSPERQRQALLKIAELSLARNRLPQAVQMLETFCARHRDAASRDLALVTLGELHLRQHLTLGAPAAATNGLASTNSLQQAMAALNTLVKEFPQSPLLGKAQLDLGWGYWLEEKLPEAQAAFQSAVEKLPVGMDLAAAHFKLGDTRFRLKDYAGAITNYEAVVGRFSDIPEAKTNLFEPALYQMVRAALDSGNLAAATNGMARLLAWYPEGFHTDRAVLLTGQQVARVQTPAQARQIFTDFLKAAPNAALAPEVELAIARTFEQEGKWAETVAAYEAWLARFSLTTNSVPVDPASVSRAEFDRAWASFKVGAETNAFTQFTNFIARFPDHEWVPLAQWWVADYFFRTGKLADAERTYQLIYLSTNSPRSTNSYQAQMMAGRTAVARQGWNDAVSYFTNLTSDIKCPPEIWLQAMFAYGDALISRDSTNKVADLEEAAAVFTRIYETYPTNQMAVLAMGEKANCLLQWAQFTQQYEPATNEFTKVIQSPLANPTARAIARVGLGVVLEKQAEQKPAADRPALLKQALSHYLDVLYYDKDLRDTERPDVFWVKKAGLEAARLAEAMSEWSQAVRIYGRLTEVLPALASSFEKKLVKAEENAGRVEMKK